MEIGNSAVVGQKLDHYQSLKASYFSLMSSRRLPIGKVRAYVGVECSLRESVLLASGHDPDEAHIVSLSEALDSVDRIRDKDELETRLLSGIREWRASKRDGFSLPEGHIQETDSTKPTEHARSVISLFSGAMGLDLGFLGSGFTILLANDIENDSRRTVAANLPNLKFINRDIDEVAPSELMAEAGVAPGELDLLIGGPPCQPFSPAGKRAGLSDPRASPLKYFIRAIREIRPAAFVMEEVPGLLSSRLKHFPYYDKYKRKPEGDEVRGSAFSVVLQMLQSTGYRYSYAVLNAADFGAPQVRKRVVFIGLRDGVPSFPKPTHSGDGLPGREPWVTVWEAARHLRYTRGMELSSEDADFMSYVPPGGNWQLMPDKIKENAMGRALYSEGGRMGFYRRIPWDEPAPTLVTTPAQKGTFLVHPEMNRFLSVEEYKALQGFPEGWDIQGSIESRYRLIGNAVPVHLSSAVARHALKILSGEV
jgi:DNA (cytosine-5)-methyltransferase 1